MSYDYIDSLPPLQKQYHEFSEILRSGQSANKNSYYYSESKSRKGSGPAAIVHIGEHDEEEEVIYIYDRSAKLKKL